jgi:hypothetical protein
MSTGTMLKTTATLLLCATAVFCYTVDKRDTAAVIREKFGDFKDNCFPRGSVNGCKCTIKKTDGAEEVQTFDGDEQCRKPIEVQTAENKQAMNEEFKEKYGNLKQNCFPRPGKGCRCTEKDANGNEVEHKYETDAECKVLSPAENKQAMNEEFKEKYGNLKENCFPRPGKGCRCTEKDANGSEVEHKYETDAECKEPIRQKRQSQNVRDPVRERAQQNYAAVVNELKDKFRGLKQGCFPRPKGCLCVIGKDNNGRDITERRMKDSDCKCKPGDRTCPLEGA